MATSIKDSFLDLERHRQSLEANIEKLRKSLQHWQTWEAEYEGLKEEISAITPPPSRDQLIAIGQAYEGVLVTRTEIEDILGIKIPRTAEQAVNILSRRIDYVNQNVNTVSKQLEVAENKLAAATVISAPDVRNEDGLPITEIFEELDDDGNEISSYVSTPGSAKDQLREVLQKAGIKDLDLKGQDTALPEPAQDAPRELQPGSASQDSANLKKLPKKTVKFSEDTKAGSEFELSQSIVPPVTQSNLVEGQSFPLTESPVIPVDESVEDASLRRQMLQYGMQEMGAIVAELELEEGDDFSDDGSTYDVDDSQDSSDDEDEFGRSTKNVIDDELRIRMAELELKLGVRMMENAGPGHEIAPEQEGLQNEGIPAHPTVIPETLNQEVKPSPTPDMMTRQPTTDIRNSQVTQTTGEAIPPYHSEQNKSPQASLHPDQVISLEASRPKPDAQAGVRRVPTGPPGQSLANEIVEREVTATDVVEPDEYNPSLLQAQVASEYHRMRNKMIQRQGGFAKPEEGAVIPFSEEEGGPKRVSRFRAARLSKAQE